jgi:acetyl-CoA carboxylase biotin carboxyl carrier protein
MSKGGKPRDDVFDMERIRQIIELMEQHELSEVDLQQGEEKIKLCRGSAIAPLAAPVAAAPPPAAATAPQAATDSVPDGTITIDAPMVGTFYARPNPGSETFVKVGDMVNEETVVCIVEAMKVFNEIPAECRGKVVEILAEDQQPVDFGRPLLRIQPS